MATLTIPDKGVTLTQTEQIQAFLGKRGIVFEQWDAHGTFSKDADQAEILAAYDHVLRPYMEKNGYRTADVISVQPDTSNLPELRAKFLREHTHSEDEVRFFVDGQGYFWFNLDDRQALREQQQNAEANYERERSSTDRGNLIQSYNQENRDDQDRDEMVFCVKCVAGDLLSVPMGYKHWFDLGEPAFVKTIRIFTDASGWTPHYTDSGVDARYQNVAIG